MILSHPALQSTALALVIGLSGLDARAQENSLTVPIEALKRLKNVDLEAKPAVKQALMNVLGMVKGKPAFVELVRDFKLTNENPALVEYALAHPQDPVTVD